MMKLNYKKIDQWMLPFIMLLCVSACKKAEQYYEKLHAQPEVIANYALVYGVGDTLIMDGRLNPDNGLSIRIGDAEAVISSFEKIAYSKSQGSSQVYDTIDRVRIPITQEMGIGVDRTVTVTSSGITIQSPSIEIIEGSQSGHLPKPLKLVKHADMSPTFKPLFCQNGKGSIYYWDAGQGIIRISKDGSTHLALNAATLPGFVITSFLAGGVDPQEHHLYFSAITTDGHADNAGNKVYRFCHYDMETKTLSTLNRSLYPNVASQRTQEVFTPFEGRIGEVRLHEASGIYPDSKGNVFIRMAAHALAKLDNNNVLQYLMHFIGQVQPGIWNPATNSPYPSDYVSRLIPGIGARVAMRSIAPDELLLYGMPSGGAQDWVQYDLANQAEIHRRLGAETYFRPIYRDERPYISGSFPVLTGNYDISSPPGLFGYMPLPGKKVLILYYQGIETDADNQYKDQYPAFGTLDYIEKRGSRYAPGKLLRNGYVMDRADQMLNYDEEGMVYMTADNNSVIVKTQYQ